MPKCEECEYRFLCFTLPTDARPIKVKVNWKIISRCGRCSNSKFGSSTKGYRTVPDVVGYCAVNNMVIHKDSMICKDKFQPLRMSDIDKVYEALRLELKKKNRRSKLPKYCEIEE